MDRLTQLCLLLEVVTECLMPMPITIGETVNTGGCWLQTYNMIRSLYSWLHYMYVCEEMNIQVYMNWYPDPLEGSELDCARCYHLVGTYHITTHEEIKCVIIVLIMNPHHI